MRKYNYVETLLLALLALSVNIARVNAAQACMKTIGTNQYNVQIGQVSGQQGGNQFAFNLCQTIPVNNRPQSLCPVAANAYQYMANGTCIPVGMSPIYAPLTTGQGFTVTMVNAQNPCKDNQPREVTFTVTCSTTATQQPVAVSEPANSPCNYQVAMQHPNGCSDSLTGTGTGTGTGSVSGSASGSSSGTPKHHKEGLSGGSWFLIILLVVVVVYAVAGFIVNIKVRGQTAGVGAFPNSELWKQVPGLFVDGILFTKNKIVGVFRGGYTQL